MLQEKGGREEEGPEGYGILKSTDAEEQGLPEMGSPKELFGQEPGRRVVVLPLRLLFFQFRGRLQYDYLLNLLQDQLSVDGLSLVEVDCLGGRFPIPFDEEEEFRSFGDEEEEDEEKSTWRGYCRRKRKEETDRKGQGQLGTKSDDRRGFERFRGGCRRHT